MPKRTGREVLAEIARLDPHLPLVLTSGYDEGSITVDFNGLPNLAFLRKPYQLHDLLGLVRGKIDAAKTQ